MAGGEVVGRPMRLADGRRHEQDELQVARGERGADPAEEPREERVREHAPARLGDDDADRVAAAGHEAPGGPVGDVAQLDDGGLDGAPHVAAHAGRAVDDAGDRRTRDARNLGHLLKGCAAGALVTAGSRQSVLHESALTLLSEHYSPLSRERSHEFRAVITPIGNPGTTRVADAVWKARRTRPETNAATRRPERPIAPGAALEPAAGPLCETWPVFEGVPLVAGLAAATYAAWRSYVAARSALAAADPRGRPDADADRRRPGPSTAGAASGSPRATSPSRSAWLTVAMYGLFLASAGMALQGIEVVQR